jgi:hypothetical protein
MLLLLELDLKKVCQQGLDFSRLDRIDSRAVSEAQIESLCQVFIGESYAYQGDVLQATAVDSGQNIDQLLSRKLAFGFTRRPMKSKCLVWLGRRSYFNCFLLTVCDLKGRVQPDWMMEISGFYECLPCSAVRSVARNT